MCSSARSEVISPDLPRPRTDAVWRSYALIALLAVVMMAPELAIGLTITDNYRFNLVWPEQFGELFRSGHLYPRWLPHAWKGLGTPAFYFYPPIFFWLSSIVDVLTGGALPSQRFVPIATLLVLMASGFAMFAWLKLHASERRALIGAVAYMAAPYHLYDIYCRGALAEATAYVSVPIIMLGLCRLGEGRARYLPLVSLGYAALLLSHLPTALLISLLLIPPYVFWTAAKLDHPIRFLAQAFAGGLVAITLAAIYLFPALTLLPFVNPHSLTKWFYRPETWFFWNFPSGPKGARMLFIIPASAGAALLAGATVISPASWRGRQPALLWAWVVIAVVVLIAGLIPQFWDLPGLAMVQFPSRALLIVEFAVISMIATTGWPKRSLPILAGAMLIVFAYVALALMARHTIGRTIAQQSQTMSEIRSAYLDAPEYLPSGVKVREGADPNDVEVELAKVALAQSSDPGAKLGASEAEDGRMTVAVEADRPSRISLRRYYFPHWRVRDAAGQIHAVTPDPRERVVSFEAPAGRSVFTLEPGLAPNEMLGRIVSLMGLAILALATIWLRRRRADR